MLFVYWDYWKCKYRGEKIEGRNFSLRNFRVVNYFIDWRLIVLFYR